MKIKFIAILSIALFGSHLLQAPISVAAPAPLINLSTGSIAVAGNPGTINTESGLQFTVSSSNNDSCNDLSENVSKVFDGNSSSKYCSNSWYRSSVPNEIVLHYLNANVSISGLGMTSANDADRRDPKSWQLFGSLDGSSWSLISENTYSGSWYDALSRSSDYQDVNFTSSSFFSYIKFVVTEIKNLDLTSSADSGGPVVQYSELRLFGEIEYPTPSISSFDPWYSNVSGGAEITILGSNFAPGATVNFGSAAATNVSVINSNIITAKTSPYLAEGYVNVTVTNPSGKAVIAGSFFYSNSPTLSTIVPDSGPIAGGTIIQVTGSSLFLVDPSTSVKLNGVSVPVNSYSNTFFSITVPAHSSGPVDLSVSTLGGTVDKIGAFTYLNPPTINSVSPTTGTTAGGTNVTISGSNLANPNSVTFGGVAGTIISSNSNQIVVATPARSAGSVAVVVTTAGGSVTAGVNYTYVAPIVTTGNRQSTNGSCTSASTNATNKGNGKGSSQNANAFCASTIGPSK